jgi:hypothetical protein
VSDLVKDTMLELCVEHLRVDHAHHSSWAVLCLGAIEEDWVCSIDWEREDLGLCRTKALEIGRSKKGLRCPRDVSTYSRSAIRINKTAVEWCPTSRLARVCEVALSDRVVARIELKHDLSTRSNNDGIRAEHQTILTDCDGLDGA